MGARFDIESMHGMSEITVGMTGLSEILGCLGITGLKNPVGNSHN